MHIRVEDWGEDMYWDIDGGKRFGPYPNTEAHYYEGFYLTAGDHVINYYDTKGDSWCRHRARGARGTSFQGNSHNPNNPVRAPQPRVLFSLQLL